MIPVLLILIPLVTGLVSFFQKESATAKNWALLSAVITLAITVAGLFFLPASQLSYDAAWLPDLGSRFSLAMDGMGKMLSLLTALSFPLIFAATYRN
ncbi:MAG: NADH-quinone oxidoreductase subunit M, partial [Bacteroidota bacterium]|nr:NADH-quinone oxidoreductase subunit M [Bacteroidota bacterium]